MAVTILLTLILCVLLFLMIWSAAYFFPWSRLLEFFPGDIEEKARQHKPPFPAAPAWGRFFMILCMLGFIGGIVYGGWDGVRNGFSFGQFLARFLVIFFGVKVFDILGLDYILITKTQFFQHYIPETRGCAGYHSFGFNRKEQRKQIFLIPFAALLAAWVCTLF